MFCGRDVGENGLRDLSDVFNSVIPSTYFDFAQHRREMQRYEAGNIENVTLKKLTRPNH